MIPQKILTPYNKILIFDNQLCMSNMVLIFDTDQAQINSEISENIESVFCLEN
jgi:hypothetical protein